MASDIFSKANITRSLFRFAGAFATVFGFELAKGSGDVDLREILIALAAAIGLGVEKLIGPN